MPIRPIAICILRRRDDILVFEGRDERRGLTFYRPLGGAIEFGEPSDDAVRRELQEEIGAELQELQLMTVTENLFEYEGEPGHEIVFIYEARFADPSLYQRESFIVTEETGTFRGLWHPIADFDMASAPLYPRGLLELL